MRIRHLTSLPNHCGLLVRALGEAPSQVRWMLLDLWKTLTAHPRVT